MCLRPILFLERILPNKPLGTEKHKNDQEGAVNDLSHVRGNGARVGQGDVRLDTFVQNAGRFQHIVFSYRFLPSETISIICLSPFISLISLIYLVLSYT